MSDATHQDSIIKEERVGYLKSKLNMLQGVLVLTSERLVLSAKKSVAPGLGIAGLLAQWMLDKKTFGFDLALSEIASVTQGKHGVQKNVLQIEAPDGTVYRILVKDYAEWSAALVDLSGPS